jgi:hypothetical protein
MPKFIVILRAANGTDYRRVATVADTKKDVELRMQAQEFNHALYRLDQNELADLERRETAAQEAGAVLPPADRAKLALHRQEEPYTIESIKEEKGA